MAVAGFGQRHFQPLGNTITLHQYLLGAQHRHRLLAQPLYQQLAQRFQLIGVDDNKTGFWHANSLAKQHAGRLAQPLSFENVLPQPRQHQGHKLVKLG